MRSKYILSYKRCCQLFRYYTQRGQTLSLSEGIKISDACVQKLKQLCDGNKAFLRISVESGGCSGFQYKFCLDHKLASDDRLVALKL